MIPWPAAILARYPVPHDRIPERPWWSQSTYEDGLMLFRGNGGSWDRGIQIEWHPAREAKRQVLDESFKTTLTGSAINEHLTRARIGVAIVTFPPNAASYTFSVHYSSKEGPSISDFTGASTDFGENYNSTMPMDTRDDLMKLLERLDRERPLPHPGWRVGQIWAHEIGVARIVQGITLDDRAVVLDEGNPGIIMPDDLRYLVADPACPHLAPWSPASP